MSGGTVLLIVAVIVVVVVIGLVIGLRARRRRSSPSAHIGLPPLGSLTTDGLDKEHAAGPDPAHHDASAARPEDRQPH